MPIGTSSYSGVQSDVGISGAAADRWREKMTPAEIRTVQFCSGKTASDFGYEPLDERSSRLALILPWLSLPTAAVQVLWANRSRLGGIVGSIQSRLHALIYGR